MHLLIDNFDSFTYNIVQTLGELGAQVEVYRNNAINVSEAAALKPSSLIISPGPGTPDDSGISRDLIRHFTGKIPIFGVCLGHQCIVEVNGGVIERAQRPMHGKVSQVYHDNKSIYDGISNPFKATRYHSLITTESTLPDNLAVSAYTSRGEIMGVRMKEFPVEGVQFHPESILTPEGKQLLDNFLAITRGSGR
jgi:anthranilate synthase/aminodeoxychorismate synthase-like glutamine amidotransferase